MVMYETEVYEIKLWRNFTILLYSNSGEVLSFSSLTMMRINFMG